jgi:hypothetical protein
MFHMGWLAGIGADQILTAITIVLISFSLVVHSQDLRFHRIYD